jgi:hypothetical protein
MENPSLEQSSAFLEGNQEVRFQGEGRRKIYDWVDRRLRQQDYPRRSRIDKGLLRRHLLGRGFRFQQGGRVTARFRGAKRLEDIYFSPTRRIIFANLGSDQRGAYLGSILRYTSPAFRSSTALFIQ